MNEYAVTVLRKLADAIERGEVSVDDMDQTAGIEELSSCLDAYRRFRPSGEQSLRIYYRVKASPADLRAAMG